MSMITINNVKLYVNLAKFDRGGNPCYRDKGKSPMHSHVGKPQHFQAPVFDARGSGYGYERLVWLRRHGVPLQLWEAQVFDTLASKVGKIVAPSQAAFADGVMTFDTVGIRVGAGWSLPEDLTLIWQNKRFRCRLQVEDEEWCPGWVSKPEKTLNVVHILVLSDEEDYESPEQIEVVQPNLVGGDQSRVHCEQQRSLEEEINDTGDPANNGSSQAIGEMAAVGVGIRNENRCMEEVEETTRMGKILWVNLENMEEFVANVIEGEL
ncbi:hypothetical protein L1987_85689 [Smallanthus sonchifolius]|uniref:Uncharacterized protein n=1 Tax=Smallanthus sonchifolius TaxID=185202 RepID=A0ACB8XYG1_9ASTR|nr:hypothetical protein L1987_85689 [Smallanthus sonchifolius]